MKKYINGKIVEMTEVDISKREARFSHRQNSRKNILDYEKRVNELETTVAELLAQIKKENDKTTATE